MVFCFQIKKDNIKLEDVYENINKLILTLQQHFKIQKKINFNNKFIKKNKRESSLLINNINNITNNKINKIYEQTNNFYQQNLKWIQNIKKNNYKPKLSRSSRSDKYSIEKNFDKIISNIFNSDKELSRSILHYMTDLTLQGLINSGKFNNFS